jgi:hypothetical protein
MNTNNRNVRLQQRVLLLTVTERAGDLVIKMRKICRVQTLSKGNHYKHNYSTQTCFSVSPVLVLPGVLLSTLMKLSPLIHNTQVLAVLMSVPF